ncbi:PREDICTED: asparagine--tRNA ligase, cytoplasmic 1-like [Nicotiana attenuata]|uniref:asparagine--tRNA ligase n=2 Tax=Nicotiana attenuata TaxID=49451 RepID=A0A1J6J3J2_NICAT|nr:PREDICTED: asparagine--tRNA ligase, cytoplasmic 1-like [Nicotiana attenuata]OIT04455.1 asparagine--trna ligase, cytoplasmic 1 [Nicotiana attenuata]
MSVDDSTPQVDKISLSDGVEEAQFSQRVPVRSILGRPDGGAGLAGKVVKIGGWVKTGREQGKGSFAFLEVNDGSCPANLQVIVDSAVYKLGDLVPTGTCVHVEGELKLPPEGAKQKVELRVQKVLSVGTVDAGKYPLPKTKLTLEFLRDVVHLRPRTNTISAVARIRNALAYATHTFFQKNGFLYIHTPIITTSDCEGAGEMFQVTTLISEAEKLEKELKENPAPSDSDIKVVEQLVKEKGEAVARLKADKASTEKAGSNIADINKQISAAVGDLTRAKENLLKLQERFKLGERVKCSAGIPKKDGNIDYADDFFARQAFLTVSGQLQVETYACALSSVYTFGPTFRAEQSHTSRHLAEFWMVEPEIAFADLKDDMNCAEAYVKFLCQWLLDHCLDDMEFITKFIDKGALGRLRMVTSSKFHRLTYTEAIVILEEASKTKTFENKVEWGIDLASEHERYLTEEHFKSPVIVFNYPKGIKAFYMKVNEDNKTVAAMDLLVPKVGELIGGSQREEDYEVLRSRISNMGLPLEPYEWYLDLRRYGTVKHSGFGLGFERMILFATGMENIRDVIPFPRYPGRADL